MMYILLIRPVVGWVFLIQRLLGFVILEGFFVRGLGVARGRNSVQVLRVKFGKKWKVKGRRILILRPVLESRV